MVILQFMDDSPEDAKAAAVELYKRYNERLIAACMEKLAFHKNDTGHAAEIVFNTWWRVKHRPQNYDPEKAVGKCPQEKVFRFIRGIMKKEYANWFNGRSLPKEEEYHIIYDLEDESKYTNERLRILRQLKEESGLALTGLSKAEKAIFFTYLEYRPDGKKIPRAVRLMLAEEFGLHGDDSVITYYHRARKKIKEYYKAING